MRSKVLFFSLIMLFGLGLNAQVTIDFETDGQYYTPSATEGSTDVDVFNRVNTEIGTNTSYYWAAEDISLTDPHISIDQIDVSGEVAFTLSVDLLTPNTNDWDIADEVLITYSLDGGAYQDLMWIQSIPDGDDYNAPAAIDYGFDGDGDAGFELPAVSDDWGAGVGNDFATFTSSPVSLSSNSTLDIKIQFIGLTSGDEGIYMDNISISAGSVNEPTSPQITNIGNLPLEPTSSDDVTVSATVTDDVAVTGVNLYWGTNSGVTSGTGTEIAMTNGGAGDVYATSTAIPAQANGTTVYYIIEATDGTETTTTSEQSYTVTDPAGPVEVSTIAELRAGATDGTEYKLTGEAVITFMQAYRGQKYVQDATGGILIDDDAGTITTAYNRYDGIINLTGTLGEYNGVLQFVPTADPGAANSTGNTISPESSTPDAVNTAVDDYESELLVFNNVSFEETGTFATGTNYTLTDGTNTIVFRTNFHDADYIGQDIPTGNINVTALVAEYNGTAQVTARELADFEVISITPTQLAITAHSPTSPLVNEPFEITVEAQDGSGNPANVTEDTHIVINLISGSGTLSGTYSSTMYSSTSSVSIGDLNYDVAETIEVNASTTSGMSLAVSANYSIDIIEGQAGSVFISEYMEGTSYNKAIEIYNGTGAELDLNGYSVNKASNGGGWGTAVDLSGTVAADDVYVIAHSSADQAVLDEADLTDGITNFNGNDAFGLFYNGVLIDVIGTPDTDPGNGWDVAGVTEATENHVLIRKYPTITEGNTDWASSAGTDETNSEWFVLEADDFSYIGWHGEMPTDPTLTITSPQDGSTVYSSDVNVEFTVENFQVGDNSSGTDDGHIHYTLDGGSDVMVYNTDPISLTGLSDGSHTISMWLVDNDHNAIVPPVEQTVTFTVESVNTASIYDIQYTEEPTGDSDFKDQIVETSGIVTAIEEATKNGEIVISYYIQDGSGPWNGVFVYDNNFEPAVGDDITLTATVEEYNGLTELTNVSDLTVNSSDNPLPAPVTITTAEANNEQYEGVLITVENAECTNPDADFGMWEIDDSSGSLLADDDLFVFTPTQGSVYTVTGLGHYSFDEYKIIPRNADDITIISSATELENGISLYPNPAVNFINIRTSVKLDKLEISDISGKIVYEQAGEQNQVNVSKLNQGIYFVKVYAKDKVHTMKFIKQ